MSLRAFHAVFIVASILLCGGLAAWAFTLPAGGPAGAAWLGALAVLGLAGLVPYLAWFLRRYGSEL